MRRCHIPTYDYQCDACSHKFEEIQSFTEKPLKKCPQCKKNKLRRLFGTGGGIFFKGSGFYATDNTPPNIKEAAAINDRVDKIEKKT